jgi:C-terminal processing protease CtpA/Prc
MKRFSTILAVVAVLGLSAAAQAGEGHCTAATQDCLDHMAADLSHTGWAGFEGTYDDANGTYTVTGVVAGSPAEEAGVMAGDVLYGVNGATFAKMSDEDWKATKAERAPGKTAKYMVKRDGKKEEVAIVLAEMPQDVVAQKIGKHMLEHAQVASVQ